MTADDSRVKFMKIVLFKFFDEDFAIRVSVCKSNFQPPLFKSLFGCDNKFNVAKVKRDRPISSVVERKSYELEVPGSNPG